VWLTLWMLRLQRRKKFALHWVLRSDGKYPVVASL